MVSDIPTIQPFTYQASTAFDERVQLADKLNEVIDALNLVGDIPDMQTEIDGLKQSVASLQESIGSTDTNLATVEGNLNKTISDLNALTTKVGTIETTISGIQSDITAIEGDISGLDSEVEGLKAEVVDEVSMASTSHGTVQVTIHHEDGTQDTSAPIDLALVQEGGITLQTGATDRSFNLKVTLSDGSSWQTNDFVIPEGGGTDVSVTSIQISQGTSANQIRVKIGLSDGSFINSNDWTVVTPAEFGTLKTTVQGNTGDITSLEGRANVLEMEMDTVDTEISGLDDRVTALEGSPGYNLPVATASVLGGVKIGGNITVQADGTISIPVAGSALGVVKNGGNVVIGPDGTMNVTLPSVPTQYLKSASVAVEGTSKKATFTVADQGNASKGIIIQKGTNENALEVMDQSGTNVAELPLIEDVSTQIVEGSTLRVEVNGVSSQVALPNEGGGAKKFVIDTKNDFFLTLTSNLNEIQIFNVSILFPEGKFATGVYDYNNNEVAAIANFDDSLIISSILSQIKINLDNNNILINDNDKTNDMDMEGMFNYVSIMII